MISHIDKILIDNNSQRFVKEKDGSVFTPLGVNYFPLATGWPPHIWDRSHKDDYEKDFAKIKALGLNCIRVFTSIAKLMPSGKNQVDEQVLEYMKDMLDTASKYDIYVIFSGPCGWDGRPQWLNDIVQGKERIKSFCSFTDKDYLNQRSFLWTKIAKKFSGHPALFAYELINEPDIPWDADGFDVLWAEYVEKRLGENIDEELRKILVENRNEIPENNFEVESRLLFEYQTFRNQLSYNYCKLCCDAIRKGDKSTFITLGTHQATVPFVGQTPGKYHAFDPHYIGELFDYISLHFYPYDDCIDICDGEENVSKWKNLLHAYINYMDIGKPILVEEFGLYGGGVSPQFPWRKPFGYLSEEDSADWVCDGIIKNIAHCAGFLNWGLQDHSDWGDPTRYQGFYNDFGELKELGKRITPTIEAVREKVKENPKYAKITPIELDFAKLVTNKEYCEGKADEFADKYHTFENPYIVLK